MYSILKFMEEGPVPCTILAEPIRVRLFEEDLKWLKEIYQDDPSMFIRSVVHIRIEEILKI